MWEAKFPPFCRAGAYPSPLWPSAISPRQGESSPAAPWVISPVGETGDRGDFALRGELLCPRRQSNQNAAGVRPNRPRAAPSASTGPTPDPVTGGPRPCVGRTLQNLMGRTLPVRIRNPVRFTGDTLYPHHDKLQNPLPIRLTAVARRDRPMRGAAESSGTQRCGAAGPSTRLHSWETPAQKDSGGDVPFFAHPGPGRPGRLGSRVRFCAPDVRDIFQ